VGWQRDLLNGAVRYSNGPCGLVFCDVPEAAPVSLELELEAADANAVRTLCTELTKHEAAPTLAANGRALNFQDASGLRVRYATR
jgi:hypothetical protein